MARNKDLFGGASGRIGNVIAYEMYGKSYMRSLPGQFHDRKSVRQLAQRQRMQLVNAFLGPYKDVLRMTFQHQANGRSAFHVAKSYNLLHAIEGAYPKQYVNYSKALVSMGKVPLPSNAEISQEPGGIRITWHNDLQASPFDTLMVIANRRGEYNTAFKHTAVARQAGSYFWNIDLVGGKTYDLWMVFRDYRERDFSNSFYLGAVDGL